MTKLYLIVHNGTRIVNEMRINGALAGLLLILTGAPLPAADLKANAEDEKLARQVLKDFMDAGINHDGKALAGLFRADGDLLTPEGERLSGRTQIENSVSPASVWSETSPPMLRNIRIRFPWRPDVAVADAEQVVYGSIALPAPSSVTFLLTKEDGRWLIASCRYARSTFNSLPWPP